MRCARSHRRVLLTGAAAAIALAAPLPVRGQPAGGQGQPMSAALQALARRTGVQILFRPDLVQGKTARPTHAGAADAALAELLAGSGLTYRRIADGTYAIVARERGGESPGPGAAEAASAPAASPAAAGEARLNDRIAVTPRGYAQELVVAAHLTDVENALEEQREAIGVTNVLAAEEIEQSPVSSVADLAPLIPGLSQHRDEFQGQAATGEGEYITIRGFDTAYNAYSLDGMRLAQTDAASRAVSVSLFSPFGLSSIKVDKAPTIDQDGDAIAGILDLRTPSAFDFTGRRLQIRAQGEVAEQAVETNQNALGGAVQFEYADRPTPDGRFGVYLTGYYQNRYSTAEEVAAQNAPVLDNDELTGAPRDNPDNLAMNGEQWNFYRENIERYGGDVSLDWRGETTQLHLRTLYAHYRNDMTQDQQSLRTSSIAGQLPPAADNQADDLPGLNAQAGISETDYNAASGAFSPYGVQPGHYFQFNEYDQQLVATQLGGQTRFEGVGLTMVYAVGYSYGEYANAQHYEGGQWGAPYIGAAAGNGPGVASEGVTFDLSDSGQPRPQLSPAAAAYVYDPGSARAWSIDGWNSYSREGLLTLKDDLVWSPGPGPLESLRAGFKWERAARDSDDTGEQADERVYVGFPGVSTGSLQQPLFYQGPGPTTAAFPGTYLNSFMGGAYPGPFKLVDVGAYKVLWASLEAADPANQAAAAAAYAQSRITGSEQRYAGYLEAMLTSGGVTVAPGVRYELNQDSFTSYDASLAPAGGFATSSKAYGELLPGISAVWRPDLLDVVRASVRKSYARPAFDQFYGVTSVSGGGDGNITITEPNPNLKPVEAINYDLGYERYDRRGGVFQLDLYYKDLRNVIFAAGATNTSTDIHFTTGVSGSTTVVTTLNGLDGYAYGVEFNARKRLSALPPPFDGFGLGGNVTAQATYARYAVSPTDIRSASLPNAPGLLYNMQLFYDRYGFSGALDYSYQGLALEQLQETEPDIYTQPVKTLNLSVSYLFPLGLKLGLAVQNLLDDYTYWATYGRSPRFLAQGANNEGGYVETGRMLLLNMSYAF